MCPSSCGLCWGYCFEVPLEGIWGSDSQPGSLVNTDAFLPGCPAHTPGFLGNQRCCSPSGGRGALRSGITAAQVQVLAGAAFDRTSGTIQPAHPNVPQTAHGKLSEKFLLVQNETSKSMQKEDLPNAHGKWVLWKTAWISFFCQSKLSSNSTFPPIFSSTLVHPELLPGIRHRTRSRGPSREHLPSWGHAPREPRNWLIILYKSKSLPPEERAGTGLVDPGVGSGWTPEGVKDTES